MKLLKFLLGLIVIIVGSAPIALFLPLIWLGKIEWYLMIKKFPDFSLYFIAASVFVCCLYMIYSGIRYWYKTLTKNKNSCITCKFNDSMGCDVGTHYAEKGANVICYNGELWEKKEKK